MISMEMRRASEVLQGINMATRKPTAQVNEVQVQVTESQELVHLPEPEPDRPLTVEDLMAKAIERGDTDTMQKLFEMHREMRQETAQAAFHSALSKAQGELRHIAANATNSQTNSRYATYDALDLMIRPIYVKHGFALSFNTTSYPIADYILVTCDMTHEAGFTKQYSVPVCVDGKGAKGGDVMTKTHAMGSGISYGMRYLLKMIFNVAIGEDDDDGNASNSLSITEAQVENLKKLITDSGADLDKFLRFMKVASIEAIPLKWYGRAEKVLQETVDKRRQRSL